MIQDVPTRLRALLDRRRAEGEAGASIPIDDADMRRKLFDLAIDCYRDGLLDGARVVSDALTESVWQPVPEPELILSADDERSVVPPRRRPSRRSRATCDDLGLCGAWIAGHIEAHCILEPGHGGPHRALSEQPTSTETDG